MTQAKAQTVASALIGLGYTVTVSQRDGEWTVQASGSEIQSSAVANFASAQAVTGLVSHATFI